MARFLPALLLALFGLWCGTFEQGATFPGWTAACAALLGTLLWAGADWQDPLRLGAAGRFLPPALWIAVAASGWASPVGRAGKVGILLLPALLLLPGVVARCWRPRTAPGLRAVAAVVAAASLWALIDAGVRGGRAAMPLGHHNLLATWLVILLPLAVMPVRDRGAWRVLGWSAGALGVAAVLASRSLLGTAALVVEAGLALGAVRRWRRVRRVMIPIVLAGIALQAPRLARVLEGEDPSAHTRAIYYEAAWEGLRARPLLGWGPGSTAWTAAAFFDPVPGARPAREVVGELHSLPLHLAYETGWTGLLLALATVALFVWRRLRELRRSPDPMAVAGLIGLAGAGVAFLGTGALYVTALPVALAVAAGATIREPGRGSMPVRVYALAAAFALLPAGLALWHYERAELTRAAELDPRFPLYRMRLALQNGDARAALAAAEDGQAVVPFWLIAGVLGDAAGRPWAGAALARACALDPLDGLPPFYLMLADPAAVEAPLHGAHALLAEPRLIAAAAWEDHPELLARTLETVRAWAGVNPGWREALIAAAPQAGQGAPGELALEIDAVPSLSLSLHAFRRRPRPTVWPLVTVHREAAERLRVPPATVLPGTSADLPGLDLCRKSLP
ncbi:MAG TPA: O-antigen ligase family protein [Thermoanaerobaculia bacterium]|nr:O-antigen ligase family protein [Thermoanaerobaculia bacterium]